MILDASVATLRLHTKESVVELIYAQTCIIVQLRHSHSKDIDAAYFPGANATMEVLVARSYDTSETQLFRLRS